MIQMIGLGFSIWLLAGLLVARTRYRERMRRQLAEAMMHRAVGA